VTLPSQLENVSDTKLWYYTQIHRQVCFVLAKTRLSRDEVMVCVW